MPRRRARQYSGFFGVNLNNTPPLLDSRYLVKANNLWVDGEQLKTRPGRVELTENQAEAKVPLGLSTYNDPSSTRKLVVVMSDGIYMRSGDA